MREVVPAGKKAVCLLSGGLDSATALFVARKEGYRVITMTFDYGQRHAKEIQIAEFFSAEFAEEHYQIPITLPWKGSALLDQKMDISNRPETRIVGGRAIVHNFNLKSGSLRSPLPKMSGKTAVGNTPNGTQIRYGLNLVQRIIQNGSTCYRQEWFGLVFR